MELSSVVRIGGCATRINILGLLFDGVEVEDILPVRMKASCRNNLTKNCALEKCHRYRVGTVGSSRISWDKKGKMM